MTKFRLLLAAGMIASTGLLSGCLGVAVGAGATVGSAAAEERGLEGAVDDTKIRMQINDLWFRRDVEMYRKVGLTIHEGRVLLTGVVPTDQARTDAVQLSWQASGVREVYNEIEVVPSGQQFGDYSSDTLIEEKLKARLLFDREVRNINYSVTVVNGVVYVMGVAQSQDELDRVFAHARDISGVKRVVNHVVIKTDAKRVSG